MPGNPPPAEHQWLAAMHRRRLNEARERYQIAAGAPVSAMQEFQARHLPANGGVHLISALRSERLARKKYMQMLRVITGLVVSRKLPAAQ